LFDTSVGYTPPSAAPNDDGLNFMIDLTAADVIETGIVVENPPAEQRAHIEDLTFVTAPGGGIGVSDEDRQATVAARAEAINNALAEVETRATFKLKSMTREFSTPYQVEVTDLKIPTGYDLEAA